MARYRFIFCPLLIALWCTASTAVAGLEEQRRLFRDADAAIAAGDPVDLEVVRRKLGDYPLTPYLRYRFLRERLEQVDARTLLDFTTEHAALPVTHGLERRWLMRAGADERWTDFRRVDRGQTGTSLACYRLRAERDADGVDASWIERARDLWLVGRSQPNACDAVFDELYRRDALSEADRWRRVNLLMQAGQAHVARALRPRLDDENHRQWLDHWLEVASAPRHALERPAFDITVGMGRKLLEYGLKQVGRSDPQAAFDLLDRYRDRLPAETVRTLHRHSALQAAYSADPRAVAWLLELPIEARDSHVAEWTARAALRAQDWARLLELLPAMPPGMRAEAEWQYWRAVALAHEGNPAGAREILEPLSERRHYYGFLAADLLDRPYRMNHRRAARNGAAVDALAERPGLIRARELFFVGGFDEYARREWHTALAGADAATWRDAAQIALDWGWYGRVVDAATRAGLHDALELRFPLAFRDSMEREIGAGRVDLALAYALVRKESVFEPEAVSHAGARGLMQLLPGTARQVSRELGMPSPSVAALYEPDLNLRLGRAYLDAMLVRFDGNPAMAAAAYNAGPRPVERWREEHANKSGPLWVEGITYGETRDYVKSVLAFRAVFDWQLGNTPRRLTAAMNVGRDLAWIDLD